MPKLTLNNITSGFTSTTALNAAFDAIEAAMENTVSRNGASPNGMLADLDMNGKRILNQLAQSGEGFIWKGPWVAGTTYVLNNLVSNAGSTYIRTATAAANVVFATDLAAGAYQLIAQLGTSVGGLAPTNNLSELTATAATARGNIGVAIGANVQAWDAQLDTLAAITATQATDLAALSPFMGTVLNDLDAAAARATLVVVAATDTVAGLIELATNAEVAAGTDTVRAVTPSGMAASKIVSGVPVASTSGTAIDYTGIPAYVKRITINFSAVSLSGTAHLLIQLGDLGGFEAVGYESTSIDANNVGGSAGVASTAGFVIYASSAARSINGSMVINLLEASTFLWVASSAVSTGGADIVVSCGNKALSEALNSIRVTTTNGTDTFDAGKINILYE